MLLRPFLYEPTACASYLFGCTTHGKLAVLDPHEALVDDYLEAAERLSAPIVAVFETHVQGDHVSGLPELVSETGAQAYLPEGAPVSFAHTPLGDGAVVELGNTLVRALTTPGHAPAHLAYLVSDRRRGTEEPWLVFSGDSLLVNDVGRPDLHAGEAGEVSELARQQFRSMRRLLELPDHLLLYPSHYGGSVCGRGLSSHPFSTIGFERRFNPQLQIRDEEAFAEALQESPPPKPAGQEAIVAANKSGLISESRASSLVG